MRSVMLAASAALSLCAGVASASYYRWDWTPGSPNGSYGVSNAGGTFSSMSAEFDPTSHRLRYEVNFSNQITTGFWLALSPGENPKGHPGELAIVYFDASNAFGPAVGGLPKASVYGYNGNNGNESYKDGTTLSGTQTPDRIVSSSSALLASSTLIAQNIGSGRRFVIEFDATDVQTHAPLYPDAVDPWTGLAFGSKLGIWMHPVTNLTTTYNASGYLTNFGYSNQGWIDGSDFRTTLIPTPGALALLGVGGLMAGRRRRA
jgi:hypothetical protein